MDEDIKIFIGREIRYRYILSTYSSYLVKFLEAYYNEGIEIYAITPQNEPLQDEDSYPTAYLPAEMEDELIGNYFGPGLIIIW